MVSHAVRGAVAEPDVRRDATVIAIEKVMPSVVNMATEPSSSTTIFTTNSFVNSMAGRVGRGSRRR